jgi:hypothetical protein
MNSNWRTVRRWLTTIWATAFAGAMALVIYLATARPALPDARLRRVVAMGYHDATVFITREEDVAYKLLFACSALAFVAMIVVDRKKTT